MIQIVRHTLLLATLLKKALYPCSDVLPTTVAGNVVEGSCREVMMTLTIIKLMMTRTAG